MTELSHDARDAVRAAAVRQTAKLFGDVFDRFGKSPEVLVLVVEGVFAGVVLAVWRNRNQTFTRWRLRRTLHGLLRAAIRAGAAK